LIVNFRLRIEDLQVTVFDLMIEAREVKSQHLKVKSRKPAASGFFYLQLTIPD